MLKFYIKDRNFADFELFTFKKLKLIQMIILIIKYIKYKIKKILKKFYMFFLLIKAEKGKNLQLEFPIRIGGNGKLSFGNNCKITKNVYFACGTGSQIMFGNNCRIDEKVEIIAGKNAKIVFGDNCWIMKNTIIRTGNKYSFGNNVNIATNCAIFSREGGHEGELKVGNGTNIGDYTIIDVADNLIIENDIAIGPNCVIYTHDHNYTNPKKAAWKGGVVKYPVTIKKEAWVGSNVTILPKTLIDEHCVIAAGAIVTKNTDKNSIYGGIPAKKIKEINYKE